MSYDEKFEEYTNVVRGLNADTMMLPFISEVTDIYEQYTLKLVELYPELNADMIQSLLVAQIQSDLKAVEGDIVFLLSQRLEKIEVPHWSTCRPWDCERCPEKDCKERVREYKE